MGGEGGGRGAVKVFGAGVSGVDFPSAGLQSGKSVKPAQSSAAICGQFP